MSNRNKPFQNVNLPVTAVVAESEWKLCRLFEAGQTHREVLRVLFIRIDSWADPEKQKKVKNCKKNPVFRVNVFLVNIDIKLPICNVTQHESNNLIQFLWKGNWAFKNQKVIRIELNTISDKLVKLYFAKSILVLVNPVQFYHINQTITLSVITLSTTPRWCS